MNQTQDIKDTIRNYLLDEEILRKRIKSENVEFGFQFVFPPGEHKRVQSMNVFQPKNKDLLIISIGTQVSPPHIEALEQQGLQMAFFKELRKTLHLKNMFFFLDPQKYRYEISEQVFLDDEHLSKNDFYRLVRNVFNIQAYSNLLLIDFCSGSLQPEDVDDSGDFDSKSNFSLYT
ncbi:MAG: DUF2299 domain-containing protein [Promethearchaeota archaeon]|nr:MAG: DUF2299 domain-containing protein [Candidatus Lokiarchaeota archaeon]